MMDGQASSLPGIARFCLFWRGIVRHPWRITALTVCVLGSVAAAEETGNWEFPGTTRIRLDGISGDIVVRPATGGNEFIQRR